MLQKKCLRIINNAPFRSHSNELFINHGMLKLNEIISSEYLKIVFEHYKNANLPKEINNLFEDCNTIISHLTRNVSKNALFVQRSNTTTYGLNSFKHKSTTLWNELVNSSFDPSSIHTIWSFKKKLKKYFISYY